MFSYWLLLYRVSPPKTARFSKLKNIPDLMKKKVNKWKISTVHNSAIGRLLCETLQQGKVFKGYVIVIGITRTHTHTHTPQHTKKQTTTYTQTQSYTSKLTQQSKIPHLPCEIVAFSWIILCQILFIFGVFDPTKQNLSQRHRYQQKSGAS